MSERYPLQQSPVAFGAIEPKRDLWPEIERSLSSRQRARRWLPVAMAASLALALVVSKPTTEDAALSDDAAGLRRVAYLMQLQHQAELGAAIGINQGEAVNRAMEGLVAAEQQLRLAIDKGSNNPALLAMLANVHRQKLGLIKQSINVRDYT